MKPQRVLITGCGGMLGSAVWPYFKARCQAVRTTDLVPDMSADLFRLDVRDAAVVRAAFDEVRPEVVLHLAAETDLERCEVHPSVAAETNIVGTTNVSRAAAEFNCLMVNIGTAGVFDGAKLDCYDEEDEAHPINVYGMTKLLGERVVRTTCKRWLNVRAGWMVGGGPAKDKKFVGQVFDQLSRGVKIIRAVDDKFGAPTHAGDFAANLFALIDSGRTGTYHMVNEGMASRSDVASVIVAAWGRGAEVVPVPSDYFEARFWARRPRNEAMSNSKLRTAGLNLMRPWQEALREYVAEWGVR